MDPVLHMGPTKQRILERRQLSKLLIQRCQMTETTLIQTIKSKEFPLHINESPAVKNILFKKKTKSLESNAWNNTTCFVGKYPNYWG